MTASPANDGVGTLETRFDSFSLEEELKASYAWCLSRTRRSRSNFYYSFFALPRRLFPDMCVLYAFMRVSDDLGDDVEISVARRAALLDEWREQVRLALDEGRFEHPSLAALCDVVVRHAIPAEYLFAVIDGVRMDLDPQCFESFEDLKEYCYHVAGAVGLCCIHTWGFSDPKAAPLAIDCGLGFQLTNILRDVAEDARMGRCYLPQDDLRRFGLNTDDLVRRAADPAFRDLMALQAQRAHACFASARRLVPLCEPSGRPILDAMIRTYGGLLDVIEASGFDVCRRRIGLGRWRRMQIVLGALLRKYLQKDGPVV